MKLMLLKRLWFMAVLASLIAVGMPAAASAHELQTDNGISAVLHVKPGDNPVAGRSASVELFFTHTPAGFSAYQCDCLVTISRGDHMVSSVWAHPASANSAIATVTFPDQGSYEVSVDGQAGSGARRVFHFMYDANAVPAAHIASLSGNQSINGIAAVIGVVIAGILLLYFRSARKRADATSPVPRR